MGLAIVGFAVMRLEVLGLYIGLSVVGLSVVGLAVLELTVGLAVVVVGLVQSVIFIPCLFVFLHFVTVSFLVCQLFQIQTRFRNEIGTSLVYQL